MTPSIIRRFARYHGVELVVHEDAVHWALEEIAIALHGSVAPDCVLKVAQTITRIEDAEHCWRRSTVRYFNRTDAEREEAAIIAAELFAIAGVDPAKWRWVKE